MAVKKTKEIEKKLYCTSCGKEKLPRYFYKSNHPKDASGYHTVACKDCAKKKIYIRDGQIDKMAFKKLLKEMDLPVYNSLYLKVLEEEKEFFGTYLARLNTFNNSKISKGTIATWENGEGFDDVKVEQNKNIVNIPNSNSDFEITEEIVRFWGKGFEPEDYCELEDEFADWTSRYECDTKAMEKLIKQICLTEMDISKRREINEKVDAQLKTLQDLLGSSNLKPVQETGANSAEQSTFGTLIKKWENERPIPEPDPEWADVDGIKKYVQIWFLGHLCKMMGINNEYSKMYEDEMQSYRVEMPEYEEEENYDNLENLTKEGDK